MSADAFATWNTATLAGIAWRVTPAHERDRWVATADGRSWCIRDGVARATDGTRDDNGVSVTVAEMADADLREFIVEQLECYGIALADVNWMKS